MPRLFTAFPLPALRSLRDMADTLRQTDPRLRLEPSERWHLTLNFIGDVPESEVAGLAEQLKAATRNSGPVPLRLQGLGAFPEIRRPRVIWVRVMPDPRLLTLQDRLKNAIAVRGLPVEDSFVPHLTLARLRDRAAEALCQLLGQHDLTQFGDLIHDEVLLYESRQYGSGQRYLVRERIPLEGDSREK